MTVRGVGTTGYSNPAGVSLATGGRPVVRHASAQQRDLRASPHIALISPTSLSLAPLITAPRRLLLRRPHRSTRDEEQGVGSLFMSLT